MRDSIAILLVDDDANIRRSLGRMLWLKTIPESTRVFEAATGSEAFELLAAHEIDCVLLDHKMPGEPGVDWIGRFLALRPDLAIIVVTGAGDEPTAVRAMQAGAIDYIVKGTLTANALMRAITNALERIALKRAVAAQREQLLEAERQRVMVESLGAVCHHMGQPVTVLSAYLDIMHRQDHGPEMGGMVEQCREAVDRVSELLARLKSATFYGTEAYLTSAAGDDSTARILSV